MSCPVNLQALPSGVFEAVFTPENVTGRSSMNSVAPLSFPKSRSALWDGSPAGEKLRLQLCAPRKPRLVLLEKALRLAQRHARHSNKPRLLCFLLGSVCVDADEEGVTVTLDRFDPGRDQAGAPGRVPSALLPGDVTVPCVVSTQAETASDAIVQSEAELHHCFKALQQCVSSRQTLDLSQLMKVRGHVVVSQQCDAAAFTLSWSAVCPSVSVDVQPVRAVPIIPTALLRSLTSIDRPPPHAANRQRGFLTMDQSRKLLLLLESDPKASSLPLVGLWLSGVTHVYNPQVWAWCLRFLFGSALQDRVLSESGRFLLVLFGSAHRAPQFFQCGAAAPPLDLQLLSASHSVTLYQQVEGRTLQCELEPDEHSRQTEVFTAALSSFSRAARLSVSDQDSGVEDEDLSPRPSPSPHPPAQQARRIQPSVPELSLLIDSSFTSNQNAWQDPGSTHRPPPAADRKSAPPPPPAAADRKSAPPPPPAADRKSAPPPPPAADRKSAPPPPAADRKSAPPPPPAADRKSAPPPSAADRKSAPPPPAADRKSAPPAVNTITTSSSSSAPRPAAPPHLHSTPNSNLQQPCSCCSTHTYDCTAIFSSPGLPPAPPPPSSHRHTSPSSRNHPTTPTVPLSSHRHTPPPPSSPPPSTHLPPPPCPCSHPPPAPWCGDSPSSPPSHPAADPVSPPWLSRPSCVSQCCDQVGGVVPSDTYQLLLHQDRQLRLLQAQVQMLLEAQGKLQSSSRQVDTQTPRSTASIAVGTGASLFWGDPVQFPLPHPEVQAPPPSSPSPSSSCRPPSQADLSVIRPVGGAEESDITGQQAACCASDQHSGLQSPVLGESVSMYRAADDQQSFYHNLKAQLTSRLQELDSKQEVEVDESRRSSLSVLSDRSQSSQSSQSRRRQSCGGDTVVSATVRQLQQLGVDVEQEDVSESSRRVQQTVESSSTLASINPAAVLSRLSVCEPMASCLLAGGSVDLSLEANAIALRYLSDSQLSRLSLGGRGPRPGPASSNDSLLSPSNMSLATRKYMRRYGLIEEEDGEEEEEVNVQEASARQPLTEALNVKLLPQSQLIRDLRPKMQLLASSTKPNAADKENCSSRRPSLVRASSRETDGSVGNILDLSRLRQLPKLF